MLEETGLEATTDGLVGVIDRGDLFMVVFAGTGIGASKMSKWLNWLNSDGSRRRNSTMKRSSMSSGRSARVYFGVSLRCLRARCHGRKVTPTPVSYSATADSRGSAEPQSSLADWEGGRRGHWDTRYGVLILLEGHLGGDC